MKQITQAYGTPTLVDTVTGESIPSPWELETWRAVIEVDGKRQLGEFQARLTSSVYTGPIVFTFA